MRERRLWKHCQWDDRLFFTDHLATGTSAFARVEAQWKQEGEVRSGILRKPA
jgi:hypothetical protein